MAAQPLSFVDSSYKEPSASAGSDLQVQNDLVLRPRIGGFFPSVMQGVVDGGRYLAPLAALTGRRMFSRKGGGKKEDWARNRERARAELQRYGNPSGVNVNKYAAYVRKDSRAAAAFLDEFRDRKVKGKAPKAAARGGPRLQRNLKRQAQENSNAAMKEYKKLMSRRKPRDAAAANEPRREKTRKVGWANQLRAAAETIRQFEKAHPGIKRTKGNFTTLASLRRRGLNDRNFFNRYGPIESPESVNSPNTPNSPPAETRKKRFSPYRRQAAATLRNLKKKYPNLKRRPGNFMTLGKLLQTGNVGKQQEFLKTFGLPDSDIAAATGRRAGPPSPNVVARAFASARPLPTASKGTRRKMTRNEYWAAYRQANANLRTQGIAKPKPENKRRLVESRRLGLNNATAAATPASAAATPAAARAATRKRSPVRNANKEEAKARLMSVGPRGAKGPSAAQTLQFARMVKNGRENSMEEFLRNYIAKKAATAAKQAPRDSSV